MQEAPYFHRFIGVGAVAGDKNNRRAVKGFLEFDFIGLNPTAILHLPAANLLNGILQFAAARGVARADEPYRLPCVVGACASAKRQQNHCGGEDQTQSSLHGNKGVKN
jgi:hypothetical protein